MPEDNLEIRDLRHQEWLWTSKELLFHGSVDEKMYKVYSGLAAYANNHTQKAFPSIATLMERLHMGRNTVIRALQNLEKEGFISVEREPGANNIYSLLEIRRVKKETTSTLADIQIIVPSQNTKLFFGGVQDLRSKTESENGKRVASFLLSLTVKYPNAPKGLIWGEVQKFERYWTEQNGTGTRERWQMEKTFQIDRRLVTWFTKKQHFKTTVGTAGKGNKIIV